MSDHDWLQIEQAAAGCVSGSLAEWPHLRTALERYGVALPNATPATILRDICRRIVRDQEAARAKP